MPDAKYVYVSKLDAAKRQLEHAIKLFFRYGDVVVIHTLTAAAHKILRDLARAQGIKSILHDEGMELIKPEKRDYVKKMLAKPENFFKHADKDSEEQLKFFYRTTEFSIWDACVIYARLTKETIPLLLLYLAWFNLVNFEVLLDGEMKSKFAEVAKGINPEDRSLFLTILPDLESNLMTSNKKFQN